jgi:hypothetical protein
MKFTQKQLNAYYDLANILRNIQRRQIMETQPKKRKKLIMEAMCIENPMSINDAREIVYPCIREW